MRLSWLNNIVIIVIIIYIINTIIISVIFIIVIISPFLFIKHARNTFLLSLNLIHLGGEWQI